MDRYDLARLVRDVANGDQAAYRTLLDVSARLVRGYVRQQTGGQGNADIEDIVQETLLAVHTKYHSYDPAYPYLPWLRAIARHKLVDAWRRLKPGSTVPLDDDSTFAVMADTPSDASDAGLTLERLLVQLPDKQQKIVRLARLEGRAMAEIAGDLAISVADVKVSLHRAIKKLAALAQGGRKDSDADR